MVISIAYQSAGQSLAKLGIAHRSHTTHARDPTTAPGRTCGTVRSQLLQWITRNNTHKREPTTARAPPHGGNCVLAPPIIAFRNLCHIFREYKDKIVNKQDYHAYTRDNPAHTAKSILNCSNPLSVNTCLAILSKTLGGIVHI